MNELRVQDLMTPQVVGVRSDDSVDAAYQLMLDYRIRHLIVVDEDGDLVGVLTHRDLLRHSLIERAELPPSLQRHVMARIRVEEVMTSEVETVEPEGSLQDAAEVMFRKKYGCLPVVVAGRAVGILTEADFVRFFALAGQQPAVAVASHLRAS
jgi:CBS domain-containing protein